MRLLTWLLLAALVALSVNVLADSVPQIGIDCGSLAGEGRVLLRVGEQGYVYRFKCGREA